MSTNKANQTKIKVNNLILEITRECNMCCEHCLRGDPAYYGPNTQYMGKEILAHIFSMLYDIDELTFTGGEPSLNIPRIEQALTLAKERKFRPIRSFIATNGKANIDELLDVCDRLNFFCMENETMLENKNRTPDEAIHLINLIQTEQEENQYLTLALSVDQYHEPIPEINVLKLCSKKYFTDAKAKLHLTHIINRGRAEENGLSTEKRSPEYLQPYVTRYKDTDDTDTYEIDTLYVTTGGELFTDCDLSYLDMEIVKNSRFDTYLGCIQDYDTPEEFAEDILKNIADEDTF